MGFHRIQSARNVENLAETIFGTDDLLFQIPLFPIGILVNIPCENQLVFQQFVLLRHKANGVILAKFDISTKSAYQCEEHKRKPVGGLIENRH